MDDKSKNKKSGTGFGDGGSVLSAFMEYEGALKRYVRRFFGGGSDVDDIVQEAFLRSYVSEKTQKIQSPKSFLFTTARNLSLNELKKNSRSITDFIEGQPVLQCSARRLRDRA